MRYAEEVAAYVLRHWKYDPDTGVVLGTKGLPVGVRCRNYLNGSVGVHGVTIVFGLHRAAWLLMTGGWPPDEIDHRNGVRDDNRWANLRLASRSDNAQNRRRRRGSKIPTGVYPTKEGRFMVVRRFKGKAHYAGTFDDLTEATRQSNALKARLHTFHPEQPVVPHV